MTPALLHMHKSRIEITREADSILFLKNRSLYSAQFYLGDAEAIKIFFPL